MNKCSFKIACEIKIAVLSRKILRQNRFFYESSNKAILYLYIIYNVYSIIFCHVHDYEAGKKKSCYEL